MKEDSFEEEQYSIWNMVN